MKQTLYNQTTPVFIHFLSVILKLVKKAKTFTKNKKVSENKMLEGKLAPDMFNFIKQVQYSYFMALEVACNLSGRAMPTFTYDEKTFSELEKSVRRAISFLKSIKERELSSAHKKKIETFLWPKKKFDAEHYVTFMALPNFFFHITTSYNILRHLGVSIGKDDYLGI